MPGTRCQRGYGVALGGTFARVMSGKNPKFTVRTVEPAEGTRGIPVGAWSRPCRPRGGRGAVIRGPPAVCFPNGPPPPSVMKAREGEGRDIGFALFRHAEKRRASWRAVVGETDAMRYEGVTNPAGKQDSRSAPAATARHTGSDSDSESARPPAAGCLSGSRTRTLRR